jgi:hypothetical protein
MVRTRSRACCDTCGRWRVRQARGSPQQRRARRQRRLAHNFQKPNWSLAQRQGAAEAAASARVRGAGGDGRQAALDGVEDGADAIEHRVRDAIEAGAEFGFRHLGKLQRSRGAQAPEFWGHRMPGLPGIRHFQVPRLKKARGTARQEARASPFARGLCGPRGASRRAVRRFCGAGPRFLTFRLSPPPALGRRPLLGGLCRSSLGQALRPAVSELLAGGRSATGRNPDAARARWPARHRPRAPARTPRAGATGSRPLGGSGEREYKLIWKAGDKFSRECENSPTTMAPLRRSG